ncbi:unnamed protein product [Brassica oleracea var. botrytis]
MIKLGDSLRHHCLSTGLLYCVSSFGCHSYVGQGYTRGSLLYLSSLMADEWIT